MNISFKVILIIILTSSASGLIINYIRPEGLTLVAEKKELTWAGDSLFISDNIPDPKEIHEDPVTNKPEKISDYLTESNGIPETEKKNINPGPKEPAAVNLKQARKLYDDSVLFIDAREKEDYEASHIKNAINIPFDHFEEYKHLLNDVEKEKIIVTYCSGTDCDLSILLGNTLFELGYKNTYIFFGGWNDWLTAEYPIKTNPESNEKDNIQ